MLWAHVPSGFSTPRSNRSPRSRAFSSTNKVRFFVEPEFARSNYWLNLILLDQRERDSRDLVLETLNASGVMVRPAWTPMHRLPMFENCPSTDLCVTEDLAERLICIPSSAFLVKKLVMPEQPLAHTKG